VANRSGEGRAQGSTTRAKNEGGPGSARTFWVIQGCFALALLAILILGFLEDH
jgi:hypothetical protein